MYIRFKYWSVKGAGLRTPKRVSIRFKCGHCEKKRFRGDFADEVLVWVRVGGGAQSGKTYYCTRRFAPRAAYAARYDCSGRKNSVKRKRNSPCLIVISANWRLEGAKRAPPCSRKTIHRRHTHGHTAYY